MDSSSVITQVYRDDDPLHSHQTTEKVNPGAVSSSTPSKPKRPGFLKQFFCCFRPPAVDRNTTAQCRNGNKNNHGATQLPQHDNCNELNGTNTSSGEPANRVFESSSLLPTIRLQDKHKKCVVIDLDETLVHSSFVPVNNPDFIIPVEIDGTVHQVYVLKRPYVDEFLQKMGELFECVLFTASLGKYADPVTDLLDKWGVFRARLFRESCVFHRGNYVKDLSRLGRDLNQVVIIDNSPTSYLFHPENAVPIVTWFDDPNDRELLDLVPFFERLATMDSVYEFLCNPASVSPTSISIIVNSGVIQGGSGDCSKEKPTITSSTSS